MFGSLLGKEYVTPEVTGSIGAGLGLAKTGAESITRREKNKRGEIKSQIADAEIEFRVRKEKLLEETLARLLESGSE